jgi:aerobic-type carbon monoxide dehydrogenase small subunit (CoxS/CutS family)
VTDFLATPAMTPASAHGGFGTDESPRASYTLRVNGVDRPVPDAWIGESLLYVLRERLGLAGAKGGCDQGECGACSVQLDGQLTAACLVPAALAADSEIRTVEGLATEGTASDVQRALAESGAVQCGYCVPGLAMAVHDLLERNHQPTELESREALCGNLCRCTGYRGALAAVQAVAKTRAEQAEADAEPDESTVRVPEQQLPPVEQPAQEAAPGQPLEHQPYADGQQPYADGQPYPEPPFGEQPFTEAQLPAQQVGEQNFTEQNFAEQPFGEPVYAGQPQPPYVELPQQQGPQQPQPQYEYQPTTGVYPDLTSGYNAETGTYLLPHQQTPAAPEAGA